MRERDRERHVLLNKTNREDDSIFQQNDFLEKKNRFLERGFARKEKHKH